MPAHIRAIVTRADKILFVKRLATDSLFPDLWELPGGELRDGENPKSAVERLVLEDVSLTVKALDPLGTYASDQVRVFATESYFDEVRMGPNCAGYQWVPIAEIATTDVAPYVKEHFKIA